MIAKKTHTLTNSQAAAEKLSQIASDLGAGAKLPTTAELRNALNISSATLNRILGDLEVRGIVTRRHGIGIYVSKQLNHRYIALICHPSFFAMESISPFWNLLVRQAFCRAETMEESCGLYFTKAAGPGDQTFTDNLLLDLKQGRINGVLLIGTSDAERDYFEHIDMPNVSYAGPGRYIVNTNDSIFMQLAMQELVNKGCRRIAFWRAVAPFRELPRNWEWHESFHTFFRQELARHGLTYFPELVKDYLDHVPPKATQIDIMHPQQGYYIASQVFSSTGDKSQWPDAIISNDDTFTHGAITAMERLGIRPGRDIPFVTHANRGSSVLFGHEEDLILIENDPSLIIDTMFSLLEMQMNGEAPTESYLQLPPTLRSPSDSTLIAERT